MSLSRRTFFGYVGATVCALGLGGAIKLVDNDDTLLRPPGAQDLDHCYATCIKCDRCRSICETGIIEYSTISEGIISARTPKLNYGKNECTFCDKCYEVCPTGAIQAFNKKSEKIGMAIIQPNTCIAFTAGCKICQEECDYDAIVIDNTGIPKIDPYYCNGCGKCEAICPALVYKTYKGGNLRGVKVVTMEEYKAIGTTEYNLNGGENNV